MTSAAVFCVERATERLIALQITFTGGSLGIFRTGYSNLTLRVMGGDWFDWHWNHQNGRTSVAFFTLSAFCQS